MVLKIFIYAIKAFGTKHPTLLGKTKGGLKRYIKGADEGFMSRLDDYWSLIMCKSIVY